MTKDAEDGTTTPHWREVVCGDPQSPFSQEPHQPKFGVWCKSAGLLVCIGAAVCTVIFTDHPAAALVASGIFWTLFYLLLLNGLVDYRPSLRRKHKDGSTTAELLVCLVHQLGLCGGLMVWLLAANVGDHFSEWWEDGPIYDFWLERQVQISILGYELKDFAYG